MTNATMRKFGYPTTLIRDYAYWVVLLRNDQVTLGSLVVAEKSPATSLSAVAPRRASSMAIRMNRSCTFAIFGSRSPLWFREHVGASGRCA